MSGQKTLPKCKPVCGNCLLSSKTGHIFGGKQAKLGYFPWQLQLVTTRGEMGGGALISDRWVLTVAHLFDNLLQVEIHGGLVDLRGRTPEGELPMELAFIHPSYREQVVGRQPNFNHDIALIKLREKVKLGSSLSPVCLPGPGGASLPEDGSLGYISESGKMEKGRLAMILQYAEVPIVSMDECKNSNYDGPKPIFTLNMICTGLPVIASCQGDSGGPYVFIDPLNPTHHIVRVIMLFGC
ncbi:calcium-dependent serine proteinase-like [Carcharodon carcharias]|uniref:calcium-dependent serine proteinase-like n=1 Tax=Carcharodon carcharias TaxID=13397 RepID=UPI001B7E70B1|nr:calcium-dependent serine proteinase-like [Carcharodon carcharias]